jgi:hypothetical protein
MHQNLGIGILAEKLEKQYQPQKLRFAMRPASHSYILESDFEV